MNNPQLLRDDRCDSFFQIGDLTKQIAEVHCDVRIDDTTHQRWRELLGLLREFDTIVDDTDISHADALRHLESFDEFREHYPTLSPEQLPHQNHSRLLGRVATILSIGQQLSVTTDIDRFVELRILEGQQSAEMIADSATPQTLQQPNFRNSFMPVMTSLAITANLLDSISDAKRDYKSGKIHISPDRTFYTRLARVTYLHAGLGFRALAHGSIIKQFALMSGNRLKNRLVHGVTPYSSLHNITTR